MNKVSRSLLLVLVAAFLVVGALNKLGQWYIHSQNPAFLLEAVDQAKRAELVLSRTGPIYAEEYSFNRHDLSKDSLPFYIRLQGEKAAVLIKGWATPHRKAEWKIVKSDTSFTPN
ncbi:hypothetical protein [uncultured Hymenobacter sp.]|uniref:hypothetical protein n=1 Tax=uncultured Hymenobacter sp. TaxID=170016 RepID=UPI0035CB72CC